MKIIQYLTLGIQNQRHLKEPNTFAYGYSYQQSEEQKIDLCAPNLVLISPTLNFTYLIVDIKYHWSLIII